MRGVKDPRWRVRQHRACIMRTSRGTAKESVDGDSETNWAPGGFHAGMRRGEHRIWDMGTWGHVPEKGEVLSPTGAEAVAPWQAQGSFPHSIARVRSPRQASCVVCCSLGVGAGCNAICFRDSLPEAGA